MLNCCLCASHDFWFDRPPDARKTLSRRWRVIPACCEGGARFAHIADPLASFAIVVPFATRICWQVCAVN